jgi:response regulator RpfG family c-di-GMP phosphodiesterase
VTARVLLVDDEPRVLDAIRRLLRGKFEVHTAGSAAEGLERVERDGPFAVIVSDMRMPGTSGVEFLDRARQAAPHSIRVMLTGNADQQTAIEAVNRGQVFRFLAKPCEPEILVDTLTAGVRQHELQTAERDLLERTLRGSVKALTDVLAIARPEVFGRVSGLRNRIGEMVKRRGVEMTWTLDTAVRLSQVGCISVRPDLLDSMAGGEALTADDEVDFAQHAVIGADLIAAIPRLEEVASIVRFQLTRFDGGGSEHGPIGTAIPLGARLLHAATAYDRLRVSGWSHRDAVAELRGRRGVLDPDLIGVLPEDAAVAGGGTVARVEVDKIVIGMTIEEDIHADQGPLLVCRGQEVTPVLLERLRSLRRAGTVAKVLLVRSLDKKI